MHLNSSKINCRNPRIIPGFVGTVAPPHLTTAMRIGPWPDGKPKIRKNVKGVITLSTKERIKVPAGPQVTIGDIQAAVEVAREAEDRFNQATEIDLIDAATLEVTAARLRLNHLIRQARMEHGMA